MQNAEPATVRHKSILFTISRLYRSDMGEEALYEATRGVWVLASRREGAEYGMAVYQGIVREVYRIHEWRRAGTLEYRTRDIGDFDLKDRWEFAGAVAPDIRDEYVGRFVGKAKGNPVRYVNC
jgi:hypothetical protein